MARLPDENSLSMDTNLASRRGIASFDASSIGKAAQGVGESVVNLGVSVGQFAQKQEKAQNEVEKATAQGDMLVGHQNIQRAIQEDNNPDGLVERYTPRIEEESAKALAKVTDPRERELLLQHTRGKSEAIKMYAAERQKTLKDGQETAAANTSLYNLSEAAAKERDPEKQRPFVDQAAAVINAQVKAGRLTPDQGRAAQQKFATDFAVTDIQSRPYKEQIGILSGKEAFLSQTARVESGGVADAKNPNSSATGAHQFIESTWLNTVKANRPDLLKGRTEQEVLDLRKDPNLSREMAGHLYDENVDFLKKNGVDPNPANAYLAHFLGKAGAVSLLKQDPSKLAQEVLGEDQVAANSSVLQDKTIGQVITWANKKFGSVSPALTPADYVPTQVKRELLARAENGYMKEREQTVITQNKAYHEQLDNLSIAALKGDYTITQMKQDLDNGFYRSAEHYNRLVKQGEQFQEDAQSSLIVEGAISQGVKLNPYDEKHVAAVERVAARPEIKSNPQALLQLYDNTNVLPAQMSTALRGGLVSGKEDQVLAAAQVAGNIMVRNPMSFEAVSGGKELQDAGLQFNRLAELGYTNQQISQKIMEDQNPEVKKVLKENAIKQIATVQKKYFSETNITSKLSSIFDDRSWFGRNLNPLSGPAPTIGVNYEQQKALMQDYSELVVNDFKEHGDLPRAEAFAKQRMQKYYGTSNGVVVKYPPEHVLPPVTNADGVKSHDYVYDQALDALKTVGVKGVERKDIILMPVMGYTQEAWMATADPSQGKKAGPIPYRLYYYATDENGVKTLSKFDKRDFYADPKLAQDTQVKAARDAQDADVQKTIATNQRRADVFGVPETPETQAAMPTTVEGVLAQRKRKQQEVDAFVIEGKAKRAIIERALDGVPTPNTLADVVVKAFDGNPTKRSQRPKLNQLPQ